MVKGAEDIWNRQGIVICLKAFLFDKIIIFLLLLLLFQVITLYLR